MKIDSVSAVELEVLLDDPLILRVTAEGETEQTGWSDPCLMAADYWRLPDDGFWDFDFVAYPPAWRGPYHASPLRASLRWGDADLSRMKGVRVHGARNTLEARLHPILRRFGMKAPD